MWRSLLFIPVLEDRFLAKAPQRGADAIVLDMEASIPVGRKAEARDVLPSAIAQLVAQDQDTVVRINALWRAAFLDLEQAVQPGLSAIAVPLAESAAQLVAIDAYISDLEAERDMEPGAVKLVVMIETARGVRAADQILRASPRIVGVGFGVEDYLADMGGVQSSEALVITSLGLIQAARAAGVTPLIMPESVANLSDLDAFEAAARLGRDLGSEGSFAVHPNQVERVNRAFAPTPEEVENARRIVDAANRAEQDGKGVISLDGRMIDLPIIVRAQKLLERAGVVLS